MRFPDEDTDGILAQFGTYDWGDGVHFELGMTRQIIVADEDDDDEQGLMTQLECTFRFAVQSELREAGSGDLWSFDLPLSEFSTRRSRSQDSARSRPLHPSRSPSCFATKRSDRRKPRPDVEPKERRRRYRFAREATAEMWVDRGRVRVRSRGWCRESDPVAAGTLEFDVVEEQVDPYGRPCS